MSTTCPLDRLTFKTLCIKKSIQDKDILRTETIKKKPKLKSETHDLFGEISEDDEQDEGYDIEDDTYCKVCGRADQEETLLLCDRWYEEFICSIL